MTISEIRDDNFGAVLNCAVRYAVGRRSYMPYLVTSYITPLVPDLSTKTLWAIRNDINDAAKFDGLGDPSIDAPLWLALRDSVQRELIKRGKAD